MIPDIPSDSILLAPATEFSASSSVRAATTPTDTAIANITKNIATDIANNPSTVLAI